LANVYSIPDTDLALVSHYASDVGCVREINQDVAGIFESEDATRGCLLLVADGMGGAAAGEVASREAVDTVSREYFTTGGAEIPAADALRAAMDEANLAIYRRSTEDIALSGMGTTCTALAIIGRDAHLAHIGDSRAYVVADGKIQQITLDHSLAEEMRRRAGGEELATPVPSNVLTRCMGVAKNAEIDVDSLPGALRPGMTFVLCSDGLSNMVSDDEIRQAASREAPDAACATLVQLARDAGGPDNITVLIARVQKG
jgi:serine/threonine protein phosphatase PrpC